MTLFPNGPTSGDQVTFNDTTFEWNGTRWVALGSISVGPAGPTGNTGPVGDYVETFNGATGTVDTSSLALHVAGISSDGGITATDYLSIQNGTDTEQLVIGPHVINNSSGGSLIRFNVNGTQFMNASTTKIDHKILSEFDVETNFIGQMRSYAGISMDTAGITFPDGTYQSTAATEFTSSHTALLEFPDNKSYSLDAYTIANRTYNFLYGISATGGCSADLVAGGSTLGSISITPSGASASFSSSVSSGTEVSIVISGVTGGVYLEDVRLVAGYTQ